MRTKVISLIMTALLLAACASPPVTPTAEAVQPSQTEAMMTEAPVATAELPSTGMESTQAPATEPPAPELPATQAPASGLVAYQIVPGESQLQYEVGETFINDNNRFNLAVGVTSQVSGEIMVDTIAPQSSQIGTITADISQFKSDSGRRDNAIRERFLQSSQFPTVTFAATQVDGLPESYSPGQEIPLTITGDLTIRDVTRSVTFEATTKLDGDTLSGSATTTILMSDFGFGPISILGMLNTEDEAKVTLSFVARP